uniref:PsbP domain-containing protein 5ic n=1 Tax=Rhizophora mucronata TaxID=61149 RepID=A0A2P2LD01_RHIMU
MVEQSFTKTEIMRLSMMSTRSDTMRRRASGDNGAADEYRSGFLDSTHLKRNFLDGNSTGYKYV